MTINMDVQEIFGYAGDIVAALMPVAYVAAGVSLGFVVVNRIISAFR